MESRLFDFFCLFLDQYFLMNRKAVSIAIRRTIIPHTNIIINVEEFDEFEFSKWRSLLNEI